jgi:hypothetical protein
MTSILVVLIVPIFLPLLLELNVENDLQFSDIKKYSGVVGQTVNQQNFLKEFKIDFTKWFNLGTNQILLAFGLIGFLFSRKKRHLKKRLETIVANSEK